MVRIRFLKPKFLFGKKSLLYLFISLFEIIFRMYHPLVCFSVVSPFWMAVSCSCVCYFTVFPNLFVHFSNLVFLSFFVLQLFLYLFPYLGVFFLICRFFQSLGCLSLLFSFYFLFSLPLTPFLGKSFVNRPFRFSCLRCSKNK